MMQLFSRTVGDRELKLIYILYKDSFRSLDKAVLPFEKNYDAVEEINRSLYKYTHRTKCICK
jgi:hypothetical protein